jgi:hypothetical protein
VVHLEDLLRRRLPLFILSKMTPEELQRLVGIARQDQRGMRELKESGLDVEIT